MGVKKQNNEISIALVGSYPPPYGGISIHIQRLKAHLDKEGYKCTVYSSAGNVSINGVRLQPIKKTLFNLFFSRTRIVHNHDPDWRVRIVIGLLRLTGKRVVISIHGEGLNNSIKQGSFLHRILIRIALRNMSYIIADNTKIYDLLLSLGVKSSKADVVSAFIPPVVKEEDYEEVPRYIWDFMKSHKPVISAGAFRISLEDGIDDYGLDMVIELVDKLKKEYSQIGMVFCLPDIGNIEYFSKIMQEIEKKKLNESILMVTNPLPEIYPIWDKSDIFVRPTYTDGDALSVREALHLRTPVVASDACPRPDGVIIFKNRDVNDFFTKVRDVIINYSKYKMAIEQINVGDGVTKIIQIYEGLVEK